MQDLSIIVATKNEQKYIANTLSHLHKSIKEAKKHGIKAELIVVDSSDENTAAIARKFTENVYPFSGEGVSKARNYGAAKSNGRILIFMDADTIVQKNTLTDVFSIFKKESTVSTIACVSPTWHSELTTSAKLFYILDWMFIKACGFIPLLIWFYNRGDIVANRRDTFNELKGFNEALYMMEITDLLGHASKLGKIKVLPSPVFESSRRLKKWGLLKSYGIWWRNYFTFYMLKRLHEANYEVIR
jgi:glycosyltransferase involved in cell wall biosynthesis